jgi:hypothetical protein
VYKLFFVLFFFISLNIQPLFSQNNDLHMSFGTAFNTKNILGTRNKSNINFNIGYSKKKFSSQLSFNYDDLNKLKFDNSFVNYQSKILDFNIGKIDRIWSFSEQNSLILSSNARPLEAISIISENNFNTYWLPKNAKWSIEVINASTKKSYNNKNSILTGARVIFSPTVNLDFEVLQTSQWGGGNKKLNTSTIGAVLFGNSNEGNYANINKMAGFGISYLIPFNGNNYRIYGQAIGEDEAGNLPSCYAWMSGIELSLPNIKLPTITTIELIDTRVPLSTNGNCGQNTMYNNDSYDYVNYETVLGVPIDSEATSIEFVGKTKLNKNLNILYSTKLLTINDKAYSQNRISTKRSLGSIYSLGVLWKKNNINLGGNISYQNLELDKQKITPGTTFSFTSSITF